MPEKPVAPYDHLAASYDRLVDWVITERGESTRDRIGEFLEAHWSRRSRPVRRVLEICCGTGLMLGELARRGYDVTGLDRSEAMLEQARRRLGPQVPLVPSELPRIPLRTRFDAVISAAAGLNHLPAADLGDTFASVARVLRPGGSFVFDLLSRTHLERSFGPAEPKVLAAELDGVSYIWTFDGSESKAHFDLTYVQFLRADGCAPETYTKSREVHRMYPPEHDAVRSLARRAGFTGVEVRDNYTRHPAGADTRYETWILTAGDADTAADGGTGRAP